MTMESNNTSKASCEAATIVEVGATNNNNDSHSPSTMKSKEKSNNRSFFCRRGFLLVLTLLSFGLFLLSTSSSGRGHSGQRRTTVRVEINNHNHFNEGVGLDDNYNINYNVNIAASSTVDGVPEHEPSHVCRRCQQVVNWIRGSTSTDGTELSSKAHGWCVTLQQCNEYVPESIQLSIKHEDVYRVRWTAPTSYPSSVIWRLQDSELLSQTFASVIEVEENPNSGVVLYHFQAYMRYLQPGKSYVYAVGNSLGSSREISFTVPETFQFGWTHERSSRDNLKSMIQREYTDKSPEDRLKFVVYATRNSRHEPQSERTLLESIAVVDDDEHAREAPIASVLPVLVTSSIDPSSEDDDDRFSGDVVLDPIEDKRKYFKTWKVAPVYFVSLTNTPHRSTQLRRLETELNGIDRVAYPWVIVFGTKSMYTCSASSMIDRHLEDLLNTHRVDLYISGDQEHYERSYPVRNNRRASTSSNKSPGENYINPMAPIYIEGGLTSASAGPSSPQDQCNNKDEWLANRDGRVGYGKIRIESNSIFESRLDYFYLDSTSGEVIDKFTIKKKEM